MVYGDPALFTLFLSESIDPTIECIGDAFRSLFVPHRSHCPVMVCVCCIRETPNEGFYSLIRQSGNGQNGTYDI